MSSDKETHLLAAFVHGGLAALHLLGVVYNLRKPNNRCQTGAHVIGVGFSIYSVGHHIREARSEDAA